MSRLPRGARRPNRPLVVPPDHPAGTRAPIDRHAVRACLRAHQGHEHNGCLGRDCRTCARYLAAIAVSPPPLTAAPATPTTTDPT